MEKLKCAVLGATGVVGQHFLKLLVNHPFFDLISVSASEGRVGQKLGEARELVPEGIPAPFRNLAFDPMNMSMLAEKGVRIAFSALPADIAKEVEQDAIERGIYIFSNASAYRMAEKVPILIPEINAHQLPIVKEQLKKTSAFMITNANCTTTGLTMALLPLFSLPIKRLIVASYQAISGAGYPGLSAIDINNNVIPYINGEEAKVRAESLKIFGDYSQGKIIPKNWEIHAHCIRVPTIAGHLISVHLEIDAETNQAVIENIFANFQQPEAVEGLPTAPLKPVIFTKDLTRPQPKMDIDAGEPDRAKGMAVVVGRLEVHKNIIRFVTLSHNLVRGAAGGSVLNAELAFREKYI